MEKDLHLKMFCPLRRTDALMLVLVSVDLHHETLQDRENKQNAGLLFNLSFAERSGLKNVMPG